IRETGTGLGEVDDRDVASTGSLFEEQREGVAIDAFERHYRALRVGQPLETLQVGGDPREKSVAGFPAAGLFEGREGRELQCDHSEAPAGALHFQLVEIKIVGGQTGDRVEEGALETQEAGAEPPGVLGQGGRARLELLTHAGTLFSS